VVVSCCCTEEKNTGKITAVQIHFMSLLELNAGLKRATASFGEKRDLALSIVYRNLR